MRKIILITGGQRSGKSSRAEKMALELSDNPVYMATARVWDNEFRERVRRHKERRGPQWTNIEEEKTLSRHDLGGRTVLVDCCTLWATNFFYDSAQEGVTDVDAVLEEIKREFDRFTSQDATFIFVTNEIGLGGTSENAVQRRFTDLLGWFNQYVAEKADEVFLMVAGRAIECGVRSVECGVVAAHSTRNVEKNGKFTPHSSLLLTPHSSLHTPHSTLKHAVQEKIDNLNKPKGSLGRLESLAMQICLIQRTLEPRLEHPCHILFGADHGIEREGVSLSPREVTWQQMVNYGRGGGGVNMFCRQHGFKLRVVDVGVDHDFDHTLYPHIIDRKIAHGTRNFLHEPAMTEEQWQKALAIGAEQVDQCRAEGCNIVSFGEMGIGNTSPSSVLMHLLLDIPLEKCVGAGSGLDTEGVRHKLEVLRAAVENYKANARQLHNPQSTLHTLESREVADSIRHFAGFEMAAATGAMLRAAEHRMVILVDGFIMTACMLAASRLDSGVMDYAVFGHCGDEGGHRLMLDAMGAQPLLSLGLRLGEGTGAICAYPIVQSSVNMINEMDNFSHANITKYF